MAINTKDIPYGCNPLEELKKSLDININKPVDLVDNIKKITKSKKNV